MDFTTTISLLVIIASSVYIYINHLYTYWKRKGFPYVEPKIPNGNITTDEQFFVMLNKLYTNLKQQNAPFGGIYLFHQPLLMAVDLEFIKQILIKDFHYFTDRGIYYNEKSDPLSAHLLSVDGERWKRLRNQLTPTFTSGKMKFMFPTVLNVADELMKTIQNLMIVKTETSIDIDMKELLARYTTDVIGTCVTDVIGIDCNSLMDPNAEFRCMGRKAIEQQKYSPPILFLISANKSFCNRLGIKILFDDVSAFFRKIVRETIAYRSANEIKRNDFMSILLGAKGMDALTENEIAAQVFLFFIAGFETSATTMTFMMYELMMNPDVQTKAREEIKNVLEKYNGEVTYEAMMEMDYLEQVVNETLRKHSPIGNLVRKVIQDYPVPNAQGKVLSKGLGIFIPIHSIHNDPDIYPEPEKFLPERFSSEQCKERSSVAFLSFGEGPRNCIGSRFAMMQVRVALAKLLMSFEITKCSQSIVPVKYDKTKFFLTPIGGMWVKLEKI